MRMRLIKMAVLAGAVGAALASTAAPATAAEAKLTPIGSGLAVGQYTAQVGPVTMPKQWLGFSPATRSVQTRRPTVRVIGRGVAVGRYTAWVDRVTVPKEWLGIR